MANADLCPTSDDLQRFLLGRLAEADAQRVHQHLAGCARCLEAVQNLEAKDTLLSAMHAQGKVREKSEDAVVEKLVAHLGGMRPPVERDPNATVGSSLRERPGTQLGPYKLLQELGEGGMGSVWMAEQTQPVQRKVALKIIKPGLDSRQIVARFEAERQALALMEHPNIAKVFDGGTTERGRPYFVMELVKGQPITAYCDEHHLTPRQRLELFLPVCQAIQHAHQKGIIHRDIKPSNVLVAPYDGRPVVKVIDFGVAKATGQRLTEKTLFTEFGAVVGTLEYMSPEQAELNNQDIDTRSDIYSLGVLLYELLAGSPPFTKKDLETAGLLEMLRVIREQEPSKPSTKLSSSDALPSLSANRGTEPAKLTKLVRGELDWIVMKALEKDRSRRYETANGFAADVQRYLADEPVQACPPSVAYRFGKFARRNKGTLAAVGLVLLFLFVLTTGAVFAAAHFERLAGEREVQRKLAVEARTAAEAASKRADESRRLAEDRGSDLRWNWYLAEMNLAGQALELPSGTGRMTEHLTNWRQGRPDLRGWEWFYLHGLCHRDGLSFANSKWGVTSIAWSPDANRVATGITQDVVVWDAITGKQSLVLKGHRSGVTSVSWSHDGTRLASGSEDSTVGIWDAATGKIRLVLRGHTKHVTSVSWSPDGTRLATSGWDQAVRVWDTATGNVCLTLRQEPSSQRVYTVTWSPDGTRLAATPWDDEGSISVWDAATGSKCLNLRKRGVRCGDYAAWSPDGTRLAAFGTQPATIMVWEIPSGKEQLSINYQSGTPLAVAWSPDGARLATAGSDSLVKVWDASTGDLVLSLRGHTEARVRAIAWSPTGTHLASGGQDGVKVWDPTTKNEPFILPTETLSLNWNRDGSRIASAIGYVKIWDPDTGKMCQVLRKNGHIVKSLAWSPDDTRMATGGYDKSVKIWDAATAKELLSLEGHTAQVTCVEWSPDGRRLASGSDDKTIKVWDVATGNEWRTLEGHWSSIRSLSWSPDGARLASASGDRKSFKVWDMATGKECIIPTVPAELFVCVSWSPNGTRLAASGDQTVTIWDAATWQEPLTLRGHTSYVSSMSWCPSGTRLASVGDRTVRIWDTATGKQCLALKGHTADILAVSWSPDGTRLASSSRNEKTIRIWDATPGYRLEGLPGPLISR